MIGIGLLGCGRIGEVHALSLSRLRGARLVAVADAMPEAAERLAAEYGAEARSAEAVIGAADVDAIIIGTPTTAHFDQIHAAAAAGKAIFCEKPIDLSSDRVRSCIEAIEAAGVPVMTAFNRRFDPHFATLERRLRAGAIGEIELVMITSRDPAPPPIGYIENSGGLFRDMTIHDLDMARFLLGEEPVEIFATGSCLVDPAIGGAGDIDTAAVTLRTASGRICQNTNSRRATYGYAQRNEVNGAAGKLSAANVAENLVEQAGPEGFTRAPSMHFFLERYEAAYALEMAHFVDARVHGAQPRPNAQDGLRAQLLAEEAERSIDEKQPETL